MLSERAKGKQRATVDDEHSSRELVVRFTEGAPDLTISVNKAESVRNVKKRIRDARPELHNHRLRLIHSGRLLTDGTPLLNSLNEQRENHDDRSSSTKPTTTWIHCSVGPLIAGELEDDKNTQTAQIQPIRGFDRLASVGFSPEDIENFRRQFHSQSSSNYLDLDFETEEEYDEHARSLEEQWIDSIDNAGSATLSQAGGASTAVLQGVLMGFFFPLIPFFFMWNRKPAVFWEDNSEQEPTSNVIFSRRMSMGLVVGFLVNILFGMWRFLLDSS
ncbi:hypothetical protein M413DRAFT_327737 [Hebeloma cylindrosporum]|uniref:Ubiquitin-like domain-containing protein n=1 Tax=Hebeloma cylindrosporum TaxID=76867 RepID=A0A0C3C882_HEBCY|nr:hypothetical protein M413DRAFT_327737 [Hebeloma cylindrosporum h7]